MRQVPALVEASKLGGWLTVQDTIKPCSYHNVVQKLTTKLIVRSGARTLAPQPARDPTDPARTACGSAPAGSSTPP